MKNKLINKQIGSKDAEDYEVRISIQANNRSPNLSHRKFQKIFCALKIPRGFFWELNINKIV